MKKYKPKPLKKVFKSTPVKKSGKCSSCSGKKK